MVNVKCVTLCSAPTALALDRCVQICMCSPSLFVSFVSVVEVLYCGSLSHQESFFFLLRCCYFVFSFFCFLPFFRSTVISISTPLLNLLLLGTSAQYFSHPTPTCYGCLPPGLPCSHPTIPTPSQPKVVALPSFPPPSLTPNTTDHVTPGSRGVGSPAGPTPSAPRDVVASLVSTRFIKLTWRQPAEPHGDELTYSLFYSQEGTSRQNAHFPGGGTNTRTRLLASAHCSSTHISMQEAQTTEISDSRSSVT